MTLLYSLFGIPRNLGEFVDKAARKRDTSVDINLGTESGLDGLIRFVHLDFHSEHARVRVAKNNWYRFLNMGEGGIKEARELSKEAALYLSGQGFQVNNHLFCSYGP